MASEIAIRHHFPAMGGQFELMCYPQNYFTRSQVQELFLEAQAEVERLENLLTDFRDSPFNRINAMAGVAPVEVSDEILDLIDYTLALSQKSSGLFDISYASVGHLWREARRHSHIPDPAAIARAQRLVDYRCIVIDRNANTVFLPEREMKIGLGGVGKGYAVDRAFELLRQHGMYNFSVNGSGDMRVHSLPSAPRPWRVAIRNPFSPDPLRAAGMVHVTNGAIATSGDYVNYIKGVDSEQRLHHIINPQSGRPTIGVASATVLADSAILADTTATLMMLLGAEEAIRYLRQHHLQGAIIASDGTSTMSLQPEESSCATC